MTPAPRRLDRPFFAPKPETRRAAAHSLRGETTHLFAAEQLAEAHRKFDCPSYAACLERAALQNWPGFSCLGCVSTPTAIETR